MRGLLRPTFSVPEVLLLLAMAIVDGVPTWVSMALWVVVIACMFMRWRWWPA
jgi:hypothetical protein